MKDYKRIVESVLERYPETQDDDFKLYSRVCWLVCGEKVRNVRLIGGLYHHEQFGLPSYESVTRARRKIQEEREDLRGTIRKRRKELEEEYRQEYTPWKDSL